jgi:hypothetical protein
MLGLRVFKMGGCRGAARAPLGRPVWARGASVTRRGGTKVSRAPTGNFLRREPERLGKYSRGRRRSRRERRHLAGPPPPGGDPEPRMACNPSGEQERGRRFAPWPARCRRSRGQRCGSDRPDTASSWAASESRWADAGSPTSPQADETVALGFVPQPNGPHPISIRLRSQR